MRAAGILLVLLGSGFLLWATAMALLGLGTALVYPNPLVAILDVAHPRLACVSGGRLRLWRDGGYAIGALSPGVVADRLGISSAIGVIAALTFASGVVVLGRMYETLPVSGRATIEDGPADRRIAVCAPRTAR